MAGSTTVGILRALLVADTAAFSKAMEGATKDVKDLADKLKTDLEPRQRAVNAAVRDFLGGTEIRRAEEYARAVEKIGGVSRLTQADQLKVNRAMQDALEHYRLMGVQAPAHLLALEKATAGVTSGWTKAQAALGAFGISLSGLGLAAVGAGLVSAGRDAVNFADRLHDLKASTGLTFDELQRLNFAGAQVGVDLETAAKAVNRLQRALVEDKGGAAAALDKLGLSVDALLKMSPWKMFQAISDAIAKLPTPAERTAAAMQLVGKSGAELLPLLGHMKELEVGFKGMSDSAIENMGLFDDFWTRTKINFKASIGEMIGATGDLRAAFNLISLGRSEPLMKTLDQLTTMPDDLAKGIPHVDAFARAQDGATKSTVASRDALSQQLDAQAKRDAALVKSIAATEKAAAVLKKYTDDVKAIADAWTKADLAERAEKVADAYALLTSEQRASSSVMLRVIDEIFKLNAAGVALDPTLQALLETYITSKTLLDRVTTSADATAAALDRLRVKGAALKPGPFQTSAFDPTMFGPGVALGQPPSNIVQPGDLRDLAAGFAQLSQVMDGNMADAVRWAGTVVSGIDLIDRSLQTLGQTSVSTVAQMASIVGIFSTVAQLAQPLLDLLNAPSDAERALMFDISRVGKGPETELERLQRMLMSIQVAAASGNVPEALLRVQLDAAQQLQRQIDELTASQDAATDAAQRQADAMSRLGLSTKDLMSPLDRANTEISELAEALGNLPAHSVDAVAAKLKGPLNDALRAALELGTKLPASMKPYLESLIRAGGLNDDLARKMLGLPEQGKTPWREMQQIAEEFGISVDNLGKNFQQSKLTEGADELARKWHLLVDNGADVNAVMIGMKDSAQKFLDNAKKWGLEVPASMRPMLEAMQRAGLLVDENGEKLEDLDDITWGRDLTKAIDDLILKLGDLIDTILGVPSDVTTTWRVRGPVMEGGTSDAPPVTPGPGDVQPTPSDFGFGLHDLGDMTEPPVLWSPSASTLAATDGLTPLAVSGGGGTMTLVFNEDGRTKARYLVPYLPGAVKELDLAP